MCIENKIRQITILGTKRLRTIKKCQKLVYSRDLFINYKLLMFWLIKKNKPEHRPKCLTFFEVQKQLKIPEDSDI